MCKKKYHRGQIVSLSKQAYNGAKVNITGSTIEVQKLKVLHTKNEYYYKKILMHKK